MCSVERSETATVGVSRKARHPQISATNAYYEQNLHESTARLGLSLDFAQQRAFDAVTLVHARADAHQTPPALCVLGLNLEGAQAQP